MEKHIKKIKNLEERFNYLNELKRKKFNTKQKK
jgi:hypothetical protein